MSQELIYIPGTEGILIPNNFNVKKILSKSLNETVLLAYDLNLFTNVKITLTKKLPGKIHICRENIILQYLENQIEEHNNEEDEILSTKMKELGLISPKAKPEISPKVKVLPEVISPMAPSPAKPEVFSLKNCNYFFRFIEEINHDKIYVSITEFTEKESLMDYINENHHVEDYYMLKKWTKQLSKLFYFLHVEKKIAHYSLSHECIYFDENNDIKVTSFDNSLYLQPDGNKKFNNRLENFDIDPEVNTFFGDYYYASPELTRSENFDAFSNDIWALGCLFFLMMTGKLIMDYPMNKTWYNKVIDGSWMQSETRNSKKYYDIYGKFFVKYKYLFDLIDQMLKPQTYRINIIDVLKHPWFKMT